MLRSFERSPVVLRDPVHGDVELTREEMQLVDTAAFQRLRGVKQLGTASLVYPGAVHTRFEHSIGVMHTTQELLDAIARHAARDPHTALWPTPEECRILRFAALLHDVTHVPFGHNLEDQTGLLARHDVPARFERALGPDSELGEVLDRLGVRREVLAILTGGAAEGSPTTPPFWTQILSDTIDADLLDYLRRDAYHTGLELHYDRRVLGYFRVERGSQRMYVDCAKQGMLREDVVSELLRVLETRFHFSERVYYHHAKIAAGALVARMVELALLDGAMQPEDLFDETDQGLVDRLARTELGDAEATERLRRYAARFKRRQLPKRVAVLPFYLNQHMQEQLLERYFQPGDPSGRIAWERHVEARAKELLGRDVDVLMYCPARRMQLKETRTLVRLPRPDEGGAVGAETETAIEPLDAHADHLPRVRDLAASYPRLWKLYVLTSETDRAARRRLQHLVLGELDGDVVNALRL
jgi:HD superfamily phosphohydrolase